MSKGITVGELKARVAKLSPSLDDLPVVGMGYRWDELRNFFVQSMVEAETIMVVKDAEYKNADDEVMTGNVLRIWA